MGALISVVIPAFNSGTYLRPALNSVFDQSYRPLEVLVVDDGSTDGTAEMVESYGSGVRLLRRQRSGHPAARNAGVRAASGEFLAFLDHDDLWEPEKLSRQMECFAREPELDLVFGHIRNFFSPELGPEERSRVRVPLEALPGLLQGAMLAKRASFEEVGFFDETRPVGDFLDWYGRAMIAELRVRMLPETVLHRRIHRANHQRVHRDAVRPGYLRAVRDLLVRRRRAAADHPREPRRDG